MIGSRALGRTLPIAAATILQDPELRQEYREAFVDPYWDGLVSTLERGVSEGHFTLSGPVAEVASMIFGHCTFTVLYLDGMPGADGAKRNARALLGIK